MERDGSSFLVPDDINDEIVLPHTHTTYITQQGFP